MKTPRTNKAREHVLDLVKEAEKMEMELADAYELLEDVDVQDGCYVSLSTMKEIRAFLARQNKLRQPGGYDSTPEVLESPSE